MSALPFVSIIIPALNAESTIGTCLESIKSLNYPEGKFEVILVDNGSKDRTREIAAQYGANVLYKPGIKIGAVRNCGAKVARGDVLAYTDSDCTVPKEWLTTAVEILEDRKVGGVGGGYLVPPDATWLERAWSFGQHALMQESKYLPGGDFILRKETFERSGGFDEMVYAAEDDDLSVRLRKEGYKLISHKSCFVVHLGYPKNLLDLARRQSWHGKSMLETKESVLDRILIATHLYLISLLALVPAALLLPINRAAFFCASGCIVLIPMLSAIYKTWGSWHTSSGFSRNLRFIYLVAIFTFFFFGRAIGLMNNYKNIIKKHLSI